MEQGRFYVASEFAPIIAFLDSVLSELNVGLVIYHLEKADDAKSLKLIYANREAERSTGLEMQHRIGKYILDAFPPLAETRLPETYREVATTKTPQRVEVPYGDPGQSAASYSVRAFPMPGGCVGGLFEREDPEGSATS